MQTSRRYLSKTSRAETIMDNLTQNRHKIGHATRRVSASMSCKNQHREIRSKLCRCQHTEYQQRSLPECSCRNKKRLDRIWHTQGRKIIQQLCTYHLRQILLMNTIMLLITSTNDSAAFCRTSTGFCAICATLRPQPTQCRIRREVTAKRCTRSYCQHV